MSAPGRCIRARTRIRRCRCRRNRHAAPIRTRPRRIRRKSRNGRRHRNQRPFRFLQEHQPVSFFIPINGKHVAEIHLFGRQQTRQWINEVPFNRTLQMARPVLQIRPFLQQKFPRRWRHAEQEIFPAQFPARAAAPFPTQSPKWIRAAPAAADETPPPCRSGS